MDIVSAVQNPCQQTPKFFDGSWLFLYDYKGGRAKTVLASTDF